MIKKSQAIKPIGNPNFKKGYSNPYMLEGLTAKQSKYKRLVLEGHSKNKAVKLAGYGTTCDSHTVEKSIKLKNSLCTAFQRIGITDQLLAQKTFEGLNANETKFFAY